MYKKVTTEMDFTKREKETLEFWKKHSIFEKVLKTEMGVLILLFMMDHLQLMGNLIRPYTY